MSSVVGLKSNCTQPWVWACRMLRERSNGLDQPPRQIKTNPSLLCRVVFWLISFFGPEPLDGWLLTAGCLAKSVGCRYAHGWHTT